MAQQVNKPYVFWDGPFLEVWETDEEGLIPLGPDGYADKRYRHVIENMKPPTLPFRPVTLKPKVRNYYSDLDK